jgi:hypothetical protein
MRRDGAERQRVGLGGVQPGLAATTAVVVLADEHRVGQQHHHRAGGRVRLEGDLGVQVALVVAVEVDLEGATDVGLVVGGVVEGDVVDLDGAVVPWRVGGRRRQPCQRHTAEERHGDGDHERLSQSSCAHC